MLRKSAVLLLVLSSLTATAFAEQVGMHFRREAVNLKTYPAAPQVGMRANVTPAATLRPAAEAVPEELDAIRVWNEEGRTPARNGFSRLLPETLHVQLGAANVASKDATPFAKGLVTKSERGIVWSGSVKVQNASRLRIHLENVRLPEGAVLWVYGPNQQPIGFDASLADANGSLWTPSIKGEVAYLELEVADTAAPASFTIREVLELVAIDTVSAKAVPRQETTDAPTCLVDQDVNCQSATEFPALNTASAAVAAIEFVSGGRGAVCSGGLLNDTSNSGTPYFLTANHCIETASEASSVEAYFDYKWISCVSSDIATPKMVAGATLLATNASSDFTLLRLSSVPANRVFLGWTSAAVTAGTRLHRISHPVPDGLNQQQPQLYSRTIVTTTSSTCSSLPRPRFIYSNENNGGEGGVYGGSSGGLVMLNDGSVVGQLLGSCGPDPQAGCDRRNNTVDGAFSESFNAIRQFLTGSGGQPGGPTTCTPSSTKVCLVNNRFGVSVTYNSGSGAQNATAIKYTPDSALFWFSNAENIEVLVKMLNACSFNQRFWLYAGGTTDQEIIITVTDHNNGTVKTYTSPRGQAFTTFTDSSAFATCP